MSIEDNPLATFADVRRDMLDTIRDIKRKDMDINRGAIVFAGYKVFNENIQVEINAAKLALATEGRAHQFGKVVGMGRRLVAGDED